MLVLSRVLGAALCAIGLIDVFLAVLQHDAVGFLTTRLYRWSWSAARRLSRPLPDRVEARVRSLVAPGMVAFTLLFWLGMQLVGFALLQYPGVRGDGFTRTAELTPSFGTALYFSAATLTSLSFGELSPKTGVYQALATAETLIGLGIITLTISYLLNLYRVLQEQNALAAALHHQAEDGGDPRSILAPHFVDGRPIGLSTHLREFHRSLVDQAEGMRRYPIVYYFQSSKPYRSIPYIFQMIGGVVAALRWGLPRGHIATRDPWLPTLVIGYGTVMREVERHYVPSMSREVPDPVPFERFRHALDEDAEDDHEGRVGEFVALDRFMRSVAAVEEPPDAEEAFERYKEWLPFATESDRFVATLADDLGTDLSDVSADPAPPSA